MKVENKNLCPESVKCLTEENSSVRIQSKRLENLMSNENGTETAIIEPTEPENLVVELDPAQILLGMFDDAPDPTPFEANNNNTLFADDLVNMNSDGSKRFKISENVSQHDFVLMIKQYPCLYDESFLGKKDLETQQLKRHAWQEIANLTEHTVDSLRRRWLTFKKKAESGNLVYVRLMSMLDDNISRPHSVSPSKRFRDSTLDGYLLKENNGRQTPAKVHFDNKENIDPKVNHYYLEKDDQFFSGIQKQLDRLPPGKQKEFKILAMVEIRRLASTFCE